MLDRRSEALFPVLGARTCCNVLCVVCLFLCSTLNAEREPLTDRTIAAEQKISMTEGGFGGSLADEDRFGSALAFLGDLDGDGTQELAVGAPAADDGGPQRGAVWILSLGEGGVVTQERKISATAGGFAGTLDDGDRFGFALAALGDLGGDGTLELAVGAPWDDDGGTDLGAVWILSLNADATVAAAQKISRAAGGFAGALGQKARFGRAVALLEDLDGNGTPELAVGAPNDGGEGTNRGAVFVLFMNADGTVAEEVKNLYDRPRDGDLYGFALQNVGGDLIVGSPGCCSDAAGRITVHPVEPTGVLGWRGESEISEEPAGEYGTALANLGDLNGDGKADLAVGTPGADDDTGSVTLYFINYAYEGAEYFDRGYRVSADNVGGLRGGDRFGRSVARLDDLNGDGVSELAVGAPNDDDGGTDRGAVWILFPTSMPDLVAQEIEFSTERAAAPLGDVDGNGVPDLLVGRASEDDARGAVHVQLLDRNGTVVGDRTISATEGGLTGPLEENGYFGLDVAVLGDLNGDGTHDIAVTDLSQVWILQLRPDSTVLAEQKISATGGWVGDPPAEFAHRDVLAGIGDINGDGIGDLAIADPGYEIAGVPYQGLVQIIFLTAEGRALSLQRIATMEGGLGRLPDFAYFGSSLVGLGDLDGDGVRDLAVGAAGDAGDLPGEEAGVWILFLNTDGTVDRYREIHQDDVHPRAWGFGSGIGNLGDFNGDGVVDLAVGAWAQFNYGAELGGAIHLLFLERDGSVQGTHEISDDNGGFFPRLWWRSGFGNRLVVPGDVDGNGYADIHTLSWLLMLQPPSDPPPSDAGGPYVASCGVSRSLELAAVLPDGSDAGHTYRWSTDCPGAAIDTPESPAAVLTLEGIADCSVTFQVTDSYQMVSRSTAAVSVLDATAPQVMCPDPVETTCESAGTVVEFTASATDNCDPQPQLVLEPPSGSIFAPGTTAVSATATDASGNVSTCTFEVTVRCGGMLPGDCNADGSVDISDGVCALEVLFLDASRTLPCGEGRLRDAPNVTLLDWNGDGDVDVSDPVALLGAKFLGGEPHVLGGACTRLVGCPSVCSPES